MFLILNQNLFDYLGPDIHSEYCNTAHLQLVLQWETLTNLSLICLKILPLTFCCPQVIPIYGRGSDQSDPRKKEVVIPQDLDVPQRPRGLRPLSIQVYLLTRTLPPSCLAALSMSSVSKNDKKTDFVVKKDLHYGRRPCSGGRHHFL